MKVNGINIRALREERGYSLSDFAKKAGLSVSYMSEIEHGCTNPSLKTMSKIADVLNVERHQLLDPVDISAGTKLRMIREDKQMTLTQTAEEADISTSYLSEIERGNVRPAIDTLKRLAQVLEVSVSVLVSENLGLGGRLKSLREEQGVTQAELARSAGVSAGLIGQIENGRVQPSLQTVEKIAGVLGVSPCYFILADADVNQMVYQIGPDLRRLLEDEKVQSVLRLVCNCSETELQFILNFIKLYKKQGAVVD